MADTQANIRVTLAENPNGIVFHFSRETERVEEDVGNGIKYVFTIHANDQITFSFQTAAGNLDSQYLWHHQVIEGRELLRHPHISVSAVVVGRTNNHVMEYTILINDAAYVGFIALPPMAIANGIQNQNVYNNIFNMPGLRADTAIIGGSCTRIESPMLSLENETAETSS